MTLDARARRAAHEFRGAVDALDRSRPERSSYERFDLFRRRRQRNARIGVTVLASVIAIIAILFGTHAFPRAQQPAAPPISNGRIAFVRFDPRSGEPVAFTMDPDGSDQAQMFFTGFFSGHSEWPHWSPDGTKVAVFCCDHSVAAQIVDPDTGGFREFPNSHPGDLEEHCGFAWSPDEQLLACGNFGKANPTDTGVWTIHSSGGGLRQLTSNPRREDDPGDFSPDGKRLVFVRLDGRERAAAIFVIGVDGNGLSQITPSGMLLDAFGGSWSPSGNQILFVARADSDHRRAIWEVNANGSDLHRLAIPGCGGPIADPGSIDCSYPGWSPDGTKIVFTRATDGGKRSDIAIVNADGSGLVQVTDTGDAGEADWGTHPVVP